MKTAVAATAAAAVLCSGCTTGKPVVVVTSVPNGSAAACARFAAHLPKTLGDRLSRRRTAPADPHVAAYGDPPVVVRCGAPATTAYQQGDQLFTVNGVGWFPQDRPGAVVWSLPRAFVNVEVTIPSGISGDHLARLTAAVNAAQGS